MLTKLPKQGSFISCSSLRKDPVAILVLVLSMLVFTSGEAKRPLGMSILFALLSVMLLFLLRRSSIMRACISRLRSVPMGPFLTSDMSSVLSLFIYCSFCWRRMWESRSCCYSF